jgi:SAM-dependent methyltransferase
MNKIKKIIHLMLDYYQTLLISCMNKDQKFSYIYKSKYWKGIGDGSLSGAGSNENTTHNIKLELQNFFNQKKIKSILDIPCGDWKWMSNMDFECINYIGCDVVKEMIDKNNQLYAKDNVKFLLKSLIDDDLPKADIIIVRDLLVHLDNSDILKCLENIKRSDFKYIAITNYPILKSQYKENILGDKWRAINLSMEPFNLIDPDYNLDDTNIIQGHDKEKYLSVWSNKKFIRRNN